MNYSTNFGLKLPQRGVEMANVNDLNDNTEDIDTIMHQNRTMLGEAYDPDKVDGYEVGDFVVQLGQFYECISDTSGVWDPTAWQLTDIGTILKALADGGGGGGGHTYSTQEQVVGTWIDGKDLYEITIANELILTNTWQQYFDASGIDTVIDVVMRTTRSGEECAPAFSQYVIAAWLHRNGYIQVSCTENDWKIHSMTVRYTKTTV